jgi:hypothetical protein
VVKRINPNKKKNTKSKLRAQSHVARFAVINSSPKLGIVAVIAGSLILIGGLWVLLSEAGTTKGRAWENLAVYPEYHGKNPSSSTDPLRSEPRAPTDIAWNELNRFEQWLGRPVKYVMQFGNPNPGSWQNMENAMYTIGSNLQGLPASNPKRIPIVSIPLSVGTTPLQDIIDGKYDNVFRNIALSYKNKGLGNTVWRLGWENNTTTWAWSSKDKSYETDRTNKYAQAWSRIRDVMYSQSSEFKFSYDFEYYALSAGTGADGWTTFSGTSTGTYAARAYPTGSQPDYIGVDIYDVIHKGSQGGYKRYGGVDWETNRRLVWDRNYRQALNAASTFAKSKGKPLVIPEWAIGRGDAYSDPQDNVGGDNVYFMKKMLDYIDDPSNNVAWHSYFNRYDKTTEGTYKINPLIETNQSWAPESAKVFLCRLKANPDCGNSTTTTIATPTPTATTYPRTTSTSTPSTTATISPSESITISEVSTGPYYEPTTIKLGLSYVGSEQIISTKLYLNGSELTQDTTAPFDGFTVGGAKAGTKQYYAIATTSSGKTIQSNSINITVTPTPTSTTTVSPSSTPIPTPISTTTPIADTTAPSAPTNVKASIIFDYLRFSYYTKLTWSASYDNVGITSYEVKRNGSTLTSTATPSIKDYGIAVNNYYTYEVHARDAAGNRSVPSSTRLIGRCFLIWCWAE